MTTGFPELDKMNQVFFYSGFSRKDQDTKKGFQNLHSETLFLSFKDVQSFSLIHSSFLLSSI